eukprot:CAMPEP_0181058814 /NCGR_PEP_ID=MMETSP1070-20121207/21032_2 /TAXON_ID=265543 /ORGANISM="Minutocellus polymorphus, Strain NH13" /LENGTH=43 /DNA_ID= /DNA_START= /DNA_END= /DNA_ORIENTATION=
MIFTAAISGVTSHAAPPPAAPESGPVHVDPGRSRRTVHDRTQP